MSDYYHPRVSPELCARIVSEYNMGESINRLSDKLGITILYVWEIVARYVRGPEAVISLPLSVQKAIVEEYQAGASKVQLAHKYHSSSRVVSSVLYIHTGKRPSDLRKVHAAPRLNTVREKVIAARKQEKSLREIAEMYSLKLDRVFNIVRDAKKEGLL